MVQTIISVEQNRYQLSYLALNQRCTEGSGLLYAIFFTLSYVIRGKAGGLQILRYQMLAYKQDGVTLAALTLKPSDFCNNGVNWKIRRSKNQQVRK